MNSAIERADRWSTGSKLLLLLTAALLPLGLALAWTARSGIQTSEEALSDVARRQGLAGSRALNSLIARNALALRVAANGALRAGGDLCRETALSLALTPGVAQNFALFDGRGQYVCSRGEIAANPGEPQIAPGAIGLRASPDTESLRYSVGLIGGMAVGTLSVPEMATAVRDIEPGIREMTVRDGNGVSLSILTETGKQDSEQLYRSSFPIADGRLTVTETTAIMKPSWVERLALFLPFLMFLVAAIASWILVHKLLLRPLRRLQRAVNEYQPGSDRLVLPERLGSAEEIRSLGASFERAVDRIEESEHQMAEALSGQRRLVREVHHRVKNNLQVVASLLNIHGRSAATQESRDAYAAIGRRVDALSVVHRNHFAEVEENAGIPLRPLLVELAAILRASSPDKNDRLVIQLDVDPLYTTQDAAVAVSFFVTEVIEYAMLTAPGKPIDVELKRMSELAATLTVSSDALLVPEEGKEPASRQQFDRVIGGLARQLRSPLDSKRGRLGVHLPVFPERG
ncbi:sensor histidine kinase [Sphingomonas sp. HDW15A]|uniref:sensor histidine kinase n=1 Tax=Sphingomonas sp. HDW15A TaxID=2714942 RepID=UPI00140E4D7B|nr:sensor histidine kinase [Sphingomonas sp. HDW15A]QIK96579.1 sensor histidine kinase [Sphingomonas sp. HDW15A]